MTEEKVTKILSQHVPQKAIEYCLSLWKENAFHLKITRSRNSKTGDFFCAASQVTPRISINNDLNPYLFLITYVHEVAHLHVHKRNRRATPHGKEWKLCFQQLMLPLLTPELFPEPVFSLLHKHMQQPKASSFADAALTKALRLFDPHAEGMITVSELPEGSHFMIRGKQFKKGELRRTRFLCHEIKSKRKYLVPAEALVSEVQLHLF
ncbi:MAG: transcription elongation protein SprT [Cyclobacteriaceae bacterium]|nr:transcription elongation protein SprT [Cyclobacteriaceae bacterium]